LGIAPRTFYFDLPRTNTVEEGEGKKWPRRGGRGKRKKEADRPDQISASTHQLLVYRGKKQRREKGKEGEGVILYKKEKKENDAIPASFNSSNIRAIPESRGGKGKKRKRGGGGNSRAGGRKNSGARFSIARFYLHKIPLHPYHDPPILGGGKKGKRGREYPEVREGREEKKRGRGMK